MFFYRYDQWRIKKFTPAGKFVLALLFISALLGIDTYTSMVYQIFSILLPLVIISFILSFRKKNSLTATRSLPDIATAGRDLDYSVIIKNRLDKIQKNFTLMEEFGDPRPTLTDFAMKREPYEIHRNAWDRKAKVHRWAWLIKLNRNAETKPVALQNIAPYGSIRINVKIKPLKRGFVYFSGVSFLLPEVLGLTHIVSYQKNKDRLLVLPKRYKLPVFLLPGSRKHHTGGISQTSKIGDSDEFISLRDYRPGDPMKQIHWKSWAKTGNLIIRENQDEHFVRHALILDTYVQIESNEAFEEAVSLAASFVSQVETGESILDLMFAGGRIFRYSSGRGLSGISKLLEILALVQPMKSSGFSRLQTAVLKHKKYVSSCILICTTWDQERIDLMKNLQLSGIYVQTFVISEDKTIPAAGTLHRINPGNVQSGLDRAGVI